MRKSVLVVLAGCLMLAACGQTRGERIVTGAAGGALVGEVVADEPLVGAAGGGLLGAIR